MKRKTIAVFVGFALLIAFAFPCAFAQSDQQILVDQAKVTVDHFMQDPSMNWLQKHLDDAHALLIVPELLKAAFVFGGSGGSGILIAKNEATGNWSQPAFYTIGEVSWGLQIGAEVMEVIIMVRTRDALQSLLTTTVKLGGDMGVAAGPVGVGAQAAVNLTAPFLSFSRAEGAYIGISLEGSLITPSKKANRKYYGKPVGPTDIILRGTASNPGTAGLRRTLDEEVGRK